MSGDEQRCLAALHEYRVLDAPADDELEAVVRVATPPAVLTCDPTLIRQLPQNLVGNAVKYRDRARACHVEVSARRHEAEWVVMVSDNGIPADQRRRVFEMFARAEPGGGTTISFTLPVAPTPPVPRNPPDA